MATYLLRDTIDPEERVEDAAMFKSLYDASGGTLEAIKEGEGTFGSTGNRFRQSVGLKYWEDPAFLANCGRDFHIAIFDDIGRIVSELHGNGKDVFVKSCWDKYFTTIIRQGQSVMSAFGDMAYSFIDSPNPLMVQELVDFTFEHRFFVVQREVITWSPAAYTLTPIARPLPPKVAWRKQADASPVYFDDLDGMKHLASEIASKMIVPSATVDIGMIGDRPAVVEFNPLRAGMVGLFACDVRALATACYDEEMCK